MRWEDAPYVKLYRDNGPWMDLSLEARGLFDELLKVVDTAGLLKLGADPVKTVARAVNGDPDRVRGYLEELTRDGCVTMRDTHLVIANFVDAQSARASDRARQAASRARARDALLTTSEQEVSTTERHASVTHESQHVTHESRSEEKRREERERKPRTRAAQSSIWVEQAKALWEEFNAARMACDGTLKRMEPTEGNLKLLIDRLAAGESPESVRHVIAVYADEARRSKSIYHFNASTPFRPENFARALSQPLPKAKQGDPVLFPDGMTPHESPATARTLHREAVERGYANHQARLEAEGRA